MSTLDTIMASLRRLLPELSSAQDAGIAGNLQVESGLDPTAHNDREGAIGLAQWEGGRRTTLQQFAAAKGTTETDLTTQVEFLANELHGPESGALAQLRAAGDAGSAAAAFDQYYERSSGGSRSTRVADAQNIAAGRPVSAGSSSGDGSVASGIGGLWAGPAFTIGIKILGAAAAAGLVIVGATHTVSGN